MWNVKILDPTQHNPSQANPSRPAGAPNPWLYLHGLGWV